MGRGKAKQDWRRVPIREVYQGLFDGPHATPKPSNEGPVFLGIGNITEDGRLDLNDVRHIAEEDFPFWTRRVEPQPGDIVFTYEATLNRYAIIPSGFRGCLGRRLALIRPNRDVIDHRFLFFYFFGEEWRKTIARSTLTGATVDRIPLTRFPDFPIDLPPRPIQEEISGVLSAYDDVIENNTRRMQILEQMAQAIYREWFVHFRFPGYEKVKLVESPLGKIPQGWVVKPLEALLIEHIGGGWGKDVPNAIQTEPSWVIRGTDIPDARACQAADVPLRYHKVSNLRARRLEAGDIIFEVSGGSKGQPVGRTLLVTTQVLSMFSGDTVICASFCKKVRPDTVGYGSELLYLSFVEGYQSGEIERFQVQSTGISNFKWTEYIQQTQRMVPPQEIRSLFHDYVAPLFAQIATLGLKSANLRRTRDLLLPKLISGELDVSELDIENAEKVV